MIFNLFQFISLFELQKNTGLIDFHIKLICMIASYKLIHPFYSLILFLFIKQVFQFPNEFHLTYLKITKILHFKIRSFVITTKNCISILSRNCRIKLIPFILGIFFF